MVGRCLELASGVEREEKPTLDKHPQAPVAQGQLVRSKDWDHPEVSRSPLEVEERIRREVDRARCVSEREISAVKKEIEDLRRAGERQAIMRQQELFDLLEQHRQVSAEGMAVACSQLVGEIRTEQKERREEVTGIKTQIEEAAVVQAPQVLQILDAQRHASAEGIADVCAHLVEELRHEQQERRKEIAEIKAHIGEVAVVKAGEALELKLEAQRHASADGIAEVCAAFVEELRYEKLERRRDTCKMRAQIEEVAADTARPGFNSSQTSSRASPVPSSRSTVRTAYAAGPCIPLAHESSHAAVPTGGPEEVQGVPAGLLSGNFQLCDGLGSTCESPRSPDSEKPRCSNATNSLEATADCSTQLPDTPDSCTRLQTPDDALVTQAVAQLDGQAALQRMIENLRQENASLRRQNSNAVKEIARTKSEAKVAIPEQANEPESKASARAQRAEEAAPPAAAQGEAASQGKAAKSRRSVPVAVSPHKDELAPQHPPVTVSCLQPGHARAFSPPPLRHQ